MILHYIFKNILRPSTNQIKCLTKPTLNTNIRLFHSCINIGTNDAKPMKLNYSNGVVNNVLVLFKYKEISLRLRNVYAH